jgi:putative transposase
MLSLAAEPSHRPSLKVTKSVSFRYSASDELSSLFEDFRCMVNDAIRIAIQQSPKSKFKLIELAYPRLKEYSLHTHYILSACEVAFSAYRNKKRKSTPYIRRAFLKLDNQSYRLDHLLLRIPTSPRNFVFLTLQGSDYHFSVIDDPRLKRGSLTITLKSVIIALTKKVDQFEPEGYIGIDTNERNATVSATNDWHHRFDELEEVAEVQQRYKEIRAGIARKTRGDRRIGKNLLAKYGRREIDRTTSRLRKLTKAIVNHAREHRLGIKMEKLNGIRRLCRKGNGQGASFRSRMNSWVFGETQRQIDYKARWEGVPYWYINPRGSSSHCLCGSRVVRLAERKAYCPKCDRTWDRDDLASKNIMACAVSQVRPSRGSGEGEPRRREDAGNPLSGWMEG